MAQSLEVAVLEGDGIGPEVMGPAVSLLTDLAQRSDAYTLSFTVVPGGAAHYQATGEAMPEASMQVVRRADAILLSAIGLPSVRYEDGTEISPHIDIRKELKLFAGVRPVRITPGINTPLKLESDKPVDFVLIRESTEGLFYSQGKGEVSDDEARETLLITRQTSEKLFRFAFELARQRLSNQQGQGRVTCVDKANVFRAFAFFRDIFYEESRRHSDIEADHAYVDATALWMVQQPWNFDVLVTENMFGDILSDLGAGLMGGLGMAPSADIGEHHAIFQPCHGSAPDLAGKGVANPFAMILSAAMMLDWLGMKHHNDALVRDGQVLRQAVDQAVEQARFTTADMGGSGSTLDAAEAVRDALNGLVG